MTTVMLDCTSCDAVIEPTDRFCPACGTPNRNAARHPRFGPPLRDLPMVIVDEHDGPSCPRCGHQVAARDPYCHACGMALEGFHQEAARAAVVASWRGYGPPPEPYHPIEAAGRTVRALLVLDAIVALVVAGVAMVGAADYRVVFTSLSLEGDQLQQWSGRLQLVMMVLLVLTAAAFLRWFRRAYRNLAPLGVRGLRLSPSWAMAGWFVPIVNLVLPKEAIDDLWRASDPDTPLLSASWRLKTGAARVHLWWVSFLVAVVSLIAAQWLLPGQASQLPVISADGRIALALVVLAHLALAFAATLLAMVVGDVTDRQAVRVELLRPPRLWLVHDHVQTEIPDEPDAPVAALLVHGDVAKVAGRY